MSSMKYNIMWVKVLRLYPRSVPLYLIRSTIYNNNMYKPDLNRLQVNANDMHPANMAYNLAISSSTTPSDSAFHLNISVINRKNIPTSILAVNSNIFYPLHTILIFLKLSILTSPVIITSTG